MLFNLTSSQKNFYNKNFTLDDQIWNQGVMEVFSKVYSYDELNNAYNRLVKAHDSLRVVLVETEDGVKAEVREHQHINYRFWQLETEEELMKKAQDFLNEPTDRYGLLVDCAVFQTPTTSGIMINAHHIVVDGFSAFVMSEHVNSFLKDPDFVPVIQKYPDYVAKEEARKQSRRYEKAKEFWLKEFSAKPECTIFPTTENTIDFTSAEMNLPISASFFDRVVELCNTNSISPASFFNTVHSTYILKRYEIESFTIGVPVLNRTTHEEMNTIGLYMHLVPLVIRLENDSFIENAKRIEDSQMNLFRHQSFTRQDIVTLLNENDISVNQLFDIVSDFQEFPQNKEYEMKIPYANALSVPIEMHLQTFGENKYNLKIRYRTAYFKEQDIQIMMNAIFAIAENALNNPNKKLFEFEMVASAEREKILVEFNSTKAEYPRDKCIHTLFEEQAQRTPDKIALVACDKTLTYKQLNEQANKIANSLIELGIGQGDIVGLMLPRNSNLLAALFGILKTGAAYLPIDRELPQERIDYMCKDTNARLVISTENIDSLTQPSKTDNPQIDLTNDALCYCIYTSGSTGQPKGVMAMHRNVVNYISKNEHNIFGKIITEDFEAILSISTCSFDIFVTETVATLVNGLRVVLADEQECRNQYALNKLLIREKAEFLQTTPTKLKVLSADPTQRDFLKSLKAILLGGEAMETAYLNELKELTNANIYNIYGVTEVPIWSTFANTDTFVDAVTIGRPIANTQVYILDKHLKPTPIGVAGELCIAGDSVSAGYLNKVELSNEKFIDNPFGTGKLYKTGDHAYWREDGNLVYIGRKDFQVKIRGLRIELGEIESVLQAVEGIERAVVVVRKDKDDRQLLCAFYTGKELAPKELRLMLESTLPKYMVPHIFTHLEKMPMTASGKANRNALPEINLESISAATDYVAPQTDEEKALACAVEKVLHAEGVSVLENFFDLGGDSLKAIELIAKLEENGYTVDVKTIFEALTIQALAQKLVKKAAPTASTNYGSELPATAAQMRVYTSQLMAEGSAHYNIPYAFKVIDLDAQRLERCINELIKRHESLRTRFENKNGEIYQVIEESASIKVTELATDDISLINYAFDLNTAPLLRVGYFENTVMIVFHHIIADGESVPIFFNELNELYMGRELSVTATQYGDFAVNESYSEDEEKYWLSVFNADYEKAQLSTDYPKAEKQSFVGTSILEFIGLSLHTEILNKCKVLNITPYAYYMACYNILLSKFSNSEDICVGTPISGRESQFLNAIGMFVNTIVLRSAPHGEKTVYELMQETKVNSVKAIHNQSYPLGELIKKLGLNAVNGNPLFDCMFAYQSKAITHIPFADAQAELLPVSLAGVKCDFNISVMPREADVVLMVDYCTQLFKEETVRKLITAYKAILSQALESDKLIKDICVLNENEIKILTQVNNTKHSYSIPEDSSIYSLFEETAKRYTDKVCLKADGKEITFGEFLNIAEQLDCEIRKYTKGEKRVIGVICDRSIEMYAAIYGIIRGGNAYMPIAPDYPQDRIEYMLKNSNAPVAIAQSQYCSLAGECCIDITAFIENLPSNHILPYACEENDTAYVIYTSGSTGKPKGAKISHKSAVNRVLWMHDKYPLAEDGVILQKTPYTFDVSVWEIFWWGMLGGCLAVSKPNEHFLPAKILEETQKNKVTHLHFVPSVFDLFLTHLENHKDDCEKFKTVERVFLSGEALSASLINRFYTLFDYEKVKLHNLYGPTECAVDVTYYDCAPNALDPVPIGKPIYNTAMYVVDKNTKLVPVGVKGELCIGGVNVGQGYLNNPELTAEKFIDNPFGDGKLYKTGDLAYWRDDGQIIFCGRIDNQIKLNGQRIELGEIENVISSISGIEACAVIIRKLHNRDVLVAFCCGNAEISLIKSVCSDKLPAYMIPTGFAFLHKLPLNASGKLDRKLLATYAFTEEKAEIQPPQNENERNICNIFGQVLSVAEIGRNSDFFELGGTSLTMISVLSEDIFKNISAPDFIANPTPEKLAILINQKRANAFKHLKTLKENSNSTKALVLFPYAGGGAESYAQFVNAFNKYDSNYSLYFVDYLHSYNECKEAALEIATLANVNEVFFYSHCAGSAVAMQILSIIEIEGLCKIKHYIAGGSIPPKKPSAQNMWHTVPNVVLEHILIKSGANFKGLEKTQVKAMLRSFRKDTDFLTEYLYNSNYKINCPVSLVMSKTDRFTKDYKNAEKLWNRYVNKIHCIKFIDTDSHYFQASESDMLVKIINQVI